MKKLSLYIFLVLMFSNVSFTQETDTMKLDNVMIGYKEKKLDYLLMQKILVKKEIKSFSIYQHFKNLNSILI